MHPSSSNIHLCFCVVLCVVSLNSIAVSKAEESPSLDNADEKTESESRNFTDSDYDYSEKPKVPPLTDPAAIALHKFKQYFRDHRVSQLQAIKSIMEFKETKPKYYPNLIDVMLKQTFKVIDEAKVNLTAWGFLPGDPFPVNETIRDATSVVFQNTALFGEMVLHFPDLVHQHYDRNKNWQLLMAWAYGFCKTSGVFEGPHQKLLHLMAQEADIIPKEPDYINPHRMDLDPKEQIQMPTPVKKKKKPKKKFERGPRLARTEL